MLVLPYFLCLIYERNLICTLWLPRETFEYVFSFFFSFAWVLMCANFKPFRQNLVGKSPTRSQLRLKSCDLVTSWLFIVSFPSFFCILFNKLLLYFHHQYVNIDCLYIKSGHNKINAIFCLKCVICNLWFISNVKWSVWRCFALVVRILKGTYQSDQGISGFAVWTLRHNTALLRVRALHPNRL